MSKNIVGLADGNVLSADYVVDEKGTKITTALLNLVYPIGSIYMSVNDVDPSVLFGGKWEKLQDRFLLGSGSKALGSSGGEENHTLSEAEMPSHNHTVNILLQGWKDWGTIKDQRFATSSWITFPQYGGTTANKTYGDMGYTTNRGSSQPHNNMPPYLTVNMWKRTE